MPTITLYQFAPAWGLPNPSPFCMKLETYLRMAQMDYEVATVADIRTAPKGKFPYIVDTQQSKTIPDSNFVLDYLHKTYGVDLDQTLTPSEKAISLSMQRLMEENLYWALLYSRWMVDENWQQVKAQFFGDIPIFMRNFIANGIRKQMRQSLYGHGMGRHSSAEINQVGIWDLNALAAFLEAKPYFMGNHPTTLDAIAFGLLANALWVPMGSPIKDHALTLQNLNNFCDRMRQQYFPEYVPDSAPTAA